MMWGEFKTFVYSFFGTTCAKVHSPKVVCDLKGFLAYEYIFKPEMCIYKRIPLRKSMSTASRFIIYTFLSQKY